MRLPRVLKRKIEKRKTTKDEKMGGHRTRVDIWGNDLWSISIMGKKNKTIHEQNKSNKLVFVFIWQAILCAVTLHFLLSKLLYK